MPANEDVLWIGPAVGQVIRTKKALVAAFAAEKHELRFAVHNLTATYFRPEAVML